MIINKLFMRRLAILNLVILSFTFILWFSCKENSLEPIETKYGNLQGTIFNSQTKSPIEAAIIKANNIVSTTGVDGKYILEDIPIGNVNIIVERSKYAKYEASIDIKEGNNNKDINLTPLFTQRLYGYVYTKFNNPIPNTKIQIEQFETLTDEKGYYEIVNIPPGQYRISAINDYFKGDTLNITIYEGEKDQNFYLTAKTIDDVVQNIKISDHNYKLKIQWDALDIPSIQGYNVYMRVYYPHSFSTNYYNPYSNYPTEYDFSNWEKINSSIITDSEYIYSSEEYNCTYQFYVLPINIEFKESPKTENTSVKKIKLQENFNQIPSNNYWHQLPNSDGELVHFIRWRWFISNYNGSNIYVDITTDEVNWTRIGHLSFDVYGGLIPVNGDMYRSLSINAYAGQNVKFRATGDTQNCIITYGVYEFIY